MLGISPSPASLDGVSLRILVEMEESRQQAAWDQTSFVCYLIAEANRNPEKRGRPYSPADFHPYKSRERKPRGDAITADNIEALQCFLPADSRLVC